METFELDLSNFQSIGKANLEFIPGINLIVGQSNSGKTAILRAIKTVVLNPSRAKYYIKKGTDEALVTINTEGNTLMWARSQKGSSKYNVNGQDYTKLGTKNLFEILERNGFVQDDSGNVMNIEGEWDLPFPFDRTPSELFRLFENIFCVSDSATILRAYKEDEIGTTKERNTLQDKAQRLTVKLKALDELENEVKLADMETAMTNYAKNIKTYLTLKQDAVEIFKNAEYSKIQLDDVLPPETYTLPQWEEANEDMNYLLSVIERNKFYKSLPPAMEVPNTINGYEDLIEDWKYIETASKLTTFQLPEDYAVKPKLLEQYNQLVEDAKYIYKAHKVRTTIDLSEECTVSENLLEDYMTIRQDAKVIYECLTKCRELKANLTKIDQRIADYKQELDSYKVCPLCGHELEGEE